MGCHFFCTQCRVFSALSFLPSFTFHNDSLINVNLRVILMLMAPPPFLHTVHHDVAMDSTGLGNNTWVWWLPLSPPHTSQRVRDNTFLHCHIHLFVVPHAWIAISFAGSDSYRLHYRACVLYFYNDLIRLLTAVVLMLMVLLYKKKQLATGSSSSCDAAARALNKFKGISGVDCVSIIQFHQIRFHQIRCKCELGRIMS